MIEHRLGISEAPFWSKIRVRFLDYYGSDVLTSLYIFCARKKGDVTKMDLSKLKEALSMDNLKRFEEVNRPVILAGVGVVGFWMAIGAAYKAAPRAGDILKNYKRKMASATTPKEKGETLLGVAKKLVPVLGPTLALGATSTFAIVKSSKISTERLTIVTAAYSLAESRLRDITRKLDEGRLKSRDVREKVSKDHVLASDIPDEDLIESTGMGNTLCYDEYRGKYFYCCAEAIGQAINTISYRLQSEMWVSLNEFYSELNLTSCKMGDDLGWNIDKTDRGRIPVYYTAILTTNNRPCLAVQFDVQVRKELYGL